MDEIVISKLNKKENTYIASIYAIKGKILSNKIWSYKYNPKVKIVIKEKIILENDNPLLIHYVIENPILDIKFFDKPTSWIVK